jgi:hypothetical protein
MYRWMLKAAVQNTVSLLPGNQSWNYLLQKYITRSSSLDKARLQIKLQYARRHLENFFGCQRFQHKEGDTFNVLELGTGWSPIIPIAFYLCGASKIWTIDKRPLLRRVNVIRTLQLFAALARGEDLSATLPWVRDDRIRAMLNAVECANPISASDILARLNIEVLIQDARHTTLEQGSVDFFLSNSVLQEIPEHILLSIFHEFRRIASTTSTMSHYVNMVEPYADFDPTLTAYHFLQYSDLTWRFINNSLHYHNRLRIPAYRIIHKLSGFRIVREDNEEGSDSELDSIQLAKQFQRYSRDELRILRTWMVSAVR